MAPQYPYAVRWEALRRRKASLSRPNPCQAKPRPARDDSVWDPEFLLGGVREAVGMAEILQWLNTAALVMFAALMAKGYLVPMTVVQEHMLKPLNDRIEALERVSSRKDDQNAELQRMQAEAIKAQSEALTMLHERGQ